MAFLDWIKRRKELSELKALSRKFGHDAIGSPGAAGRHYKKLMELRKGKGPKPDHDNLKTKPRPRPSWER